MEGWEKERMQLMRVHELQGVVSLERGLVRSPGRKRQGEDENNTTTTTTPTTTKRAKHKYPLLGENWGEDEYVEDDPRVQTPFSRMGVHSKAWSPPPQPPPPSLLTFPKINHYSLKFSLINKGSGLEALEGKTCELQKPVRNTSTPPQRRNAPLRSNHAR